MMASQFFYCSVLLYNRQIFIYSSRVVISAVLLYSIDCSTGETEREREEKEIEGEGGIQEVSCSENTRFYFRLAQNGDSGTDQAMGATEVPVLGRACAQRCTTQYYQILASSLHRERERERERERGRERMGETISLKFYTALPSPFSLSVRDKGLLVFQQKLLRDSRADVGCLVYWLQAPIGTDEFEIQQILKRLERGTTWQGITWLQIKVMEHQSSPS